MHTRRCGARALAIRVNPLHLPFPSQSVQTIVEELAAGAFSAESADAEGVGSGSASRRACAARALLLRTVVSLTGAKTLTGNRLRLTTLFGTLFEVLLLAAVYAGAADEGDAMEQQAVKEVICVIAVRERINAAKSADALLKVAFISWSGKRIVDGRTASPALHMDISNN